MLNTQALGWAYTMRGKDFNAGDLVSNGTSNPCASAYIEIYDATSSGEFITPPAVGEFTLLQTINTYKTEYCSNGHLFIVLFLGPSCGVVPPATFTTTSNTIVVHVFVKAPPGGLTEVILESSNSTNSTSEFTGPFIAFTADFTSYFIGLSWT